MCFLRRFAQFERYSHWLQWKGVKAPGKLLPRTSACLTASCLMVYIFRTLPKEICIHTGHQNYNMRFLTIWSGVSNNLNTGSFPKLVSQSANHGALFIDQMPNCKIHPSIPTPKIQIKQMIAWDDLYSLLHRWIRNHIARSTLARSSLDFFQISRKLSRIVSSSPLASVQILWLKLNPGF